MKMIYIAGPFRGPSAWAVKTNVHAAEAAAARIIADGRAFPVTPHSIGANFHGHGTEEYWLEGTKALLRRCNAVLMLPGWLGSIGARGEHVEATRLMLPILLGLEDLFGWLLEGA